MRTTHLFRHRWGTDQAPGLPLDHAARAIRNRHAPRQQGAPADGLGAVFRGGHVRWDYMGERFFAMFIIPRGLRAITIIRKNQVSSSVLGAFRQELRNESGQQKGARYSRKNCQHMTGGCRAFARLSQGRCLIIQCYKDLQSICTLKTSLKSHNTHLQV